MSSEQVRVGFVVEHALGHVTYAQALAREVAADGDIAADWMRVHEHDGDLLERLPGLPFSVKVSLRARRQIKERLRRGPLDALFIHTQALTPACADIVASIPSVVSMDATPHNFAILAQAYGARVGTGLRGAVKTALFRRIFASARALVPWSWWAGDSLVRDYGVDAARITVVPPSIDVAAWTPRDTSRVRDGKLRLLFVGGDFERKGGLLVLEAFRNGLSESCELDIVTRDERVADAPGIRVHRGLAPNTPRLRRLFSEADLFLLPSLGDASPFAAVEAMACALPVVVTNVGGMAELVRDGESGRVVPAGDARSLLHCVRALAADRTRLLAMGRAARSDAESRFDAHRNYPRVLALIKEAAATPA